MVEPVVLSAFVGGEAVSTDRVIERENPAHPHEIVGTVTDAGADVATAAVDAADEAFARWAGLTATDRAEALRGASDSMREHADEVGALLTRELGKARPGSVGEANFAALYLDQAIDDAVRLQADDLIENRFGRSLVTHRPYGPVSAIVPWNAPLILAMLKVGPALATGNTMVVKPSPLAPLALTTMLTRMAAQLPPGVLNVVCGAAEVGQVLTTHPSVRKIAFTGGLATAQKVMEAAAPGVKPLVLELGGNDPAIVTDIEHLSDSDLATLVTSVYTTSGQVCIAIKRIYVPEHQAELFLERFEDRAAIDVVLGDPMLDSTSVGPVVSAEHREHVDALVAGAVERGASARRVGQRSEMDPDGYYVEPTIVTGCADDDPLVATEQFGPTVPLLTFSDLDEVVQRANDSDLGLAASVWGPDVEALEQLGRRLEVGTTFVNSHNRFGVNPGAPFGGTKLSGFGREYGDAGIDAYLQTHAINTPAATPAGGYPTDT